MSLDLSELRAWLRLQATPGVGPATVRRLLAAVGSPQRVFEAPPAVLQALLAPDVLRALQHEPPSVPGMLERAQRWCEDGPPSEPPRDLLTLADPRYPERLLQCGDPPPLLFVQGRIDLLHGSSVAMVGSRRATPAGLGIARTLARDLSDAGVSVVSGLAAGIDAAAHEGALSVCEGRSVGQGRPGSTVAVLGTGPDAASVYPRRHRDLAERVARDGLLVTEFLPGTQARPDHFPRRNRIVAGLTRATLVVEAALPSGSLITARLALEMGRDVMAVPGSVQSPQARGCHALIKQGAQLVENAADVLEALGWPLAAVPQAHGVTPSHDAPATADGGLLRAMGHDPVGLDALSVRTGMDPSSLGVALLMLEMDGHVARLPGQLFQRMGRA